MLPGPLIAGALAIWLTSPLSAQTTEGSRCQIGQKSRVYVGLSDDVELELYETAAAIAKQIMRVVQTGVCARLLAGRHRAPESLRAALAHGRRVLLDSVQFTDRTLQRAYVLLRSEAPDVPDLVWRVQLRSERVWRIEAVLDEAPVSAMK